MLRLSRALASLALVAFVPLASPACGGGGGSGNVGDLVEACKRYCTAQAKPMCVNGLPEASCQAQCSFAEQQLQGQCIAEYTAALDCAADLTFTCTNDFPTPAPTACLAESQALNVCQQEAPCKSFCAAADAAGCAGGSQDACVAQCKDEVAAADFCDFELRDLKTCMGQQTLTCEGGVAKTSLCTSEKTDYADCLAFDDPCAGFCFMADDAGCAGGTYDQCVASCQTALTNAGFCDFEYRQLLECGAQEGVACMGSSPGTAAACTSDQLAYDDCKAQNP